MYKARPWLHIAIILSLWSCNDFRSSRRARADTHLLIISYDNANRLPLKQIGEKASDLYGFRIAADTQHQLPAEYLNYEKGKRYNAAGLLNYLKEQKPDSVGIVLALTDEDIYISKRDKDGNIKKPLEKYRVWGIFGLAHCPGVSCIVSSRRIRTADGDKFKDRLLKITLHEIGHNLGLRHCDNKKCLMTDAVEKISTVDNTSLNLCQRCRARIN